MHQVHGTFIVPPHFLQEIASLHRITVPTHIIWGENDKVIPRAYGPAFRELIKGSELTTIANCGHVPQVECEKEFVELVTSFVGGIAS